MKNKSYRFYLMLCLLMALFSTTFAQRQTGSIKGRVTDTEGFPLPGAFIYVYSPALMGMKTYVTSDTGNIRFPSLPPGQYKVIVEMPGFKTANVENIIVRVGKTVTLNITMEMTTLEEEITVKIPSPTLDVESAKIADVIDGDLLKDIPLARDLYSIIRSGSGIIPEEPSYQQPAIIHGATARDNIHALDGANMNDPGDMYLSTNINFDIIEEVELETAGHPIDVGFADGGYINVVTKSGGNNLNGGIVLNYSNDRLANSLWPEDELSSLGVSPPAADKKLLDISLSFGGPLLEDKLWFFGNARLISLDRTTPFISWTDPQGKTHRKYSWSDEEKMGFFKLTSQFVPQLRVTGMFNFADRMQPIHSSLMRWNLTEEATRILDHERNYTMTGIANYIISQNTSLDLQASYSRHKLPLFLNKDVNDNPQYFDQGTGHSWGSGSFNETWQYRRFNAQANLTHFQDHFLGGNHEFKIGGEYEHVQGELLTWKHDNLFLTYYYGSPYYFGLNESPATGNTVGMGKIKFYTAAKEEGLISNKTEMQRLSFFIQDSVNFARRLTLTFGLRFDRSTIGYTPFYKEESGNPVSFKIGEELIKPLYNVNPYDKNEVFDQKDLIVWNILSPRIGLSFDIFGHGKTVFKASFSRYSEYLRLRYAFTVNPFFPGRFHQFFWYDENMDGQVDMNDTFTLFPEDYRIYMNDYIDKRIAPDIKSPYTDEFLIGLQQELFPDFSIRFNFIYKNKKNIVENVLYDPDSDTDWYTANQNTESWWIPFNTIVPGVDNYPDTPVTVYFLSKDAPALFFRLKNVPELKRQYQAFEFSFKKRMSHNWQVYGSVVLSKATGNIGLSYDASSGFSDPGNSPNYFANLTENSRLDFDRPFVIKLMGTYKFPYGLFLSFFYTHMKGTPWARSVSIYPPSSWAAGSNALATYMTVLLEQPGSRRNNSYDNLDFRIEKEFNLGNFGKLVFFVDVFNAFGNRYRSIIQNDGGFWFPSDENTKAGLRVFNSSYKKTTAVYGTRAFRLSMHLRF